MKTMAAGLFKARCLAVMDEVQAKRETVVITKHGKPVAKLVPADKDTDKIYNFLRGKGAVTGNVISPAIEDCFPQASCASATSVSWPSPSRSTSSPLFPPPGIGKVHPWLNNQRQGTGRLHPPPHLPTSPWTCPQCGGPMIVLEHLSAAQTSLRSPPLPLARNS
jgi:prevent-host-death family protein